MREAWRRGTAAAWSAILLAGCTAVVGYPKPAFDQAAEEAELRAFVGPEAIARYEACADKTACRNTIIDARVRAVDIAFSRFERKVYGQEERVSLGSELLATSLDSIAAVTGTKALSAGAGLVTGSRGAYQKQVLNVSLPLLFETMVANRREILVRIRQGETLPAANYSLYQALDDIGDYEEAASLPAAAASIASSAGTNARVAEAKLEALRAARLSTTATALPATTAAVVVAPAAPSAAALAPGAPAVIVAPMQPGATPTPTASPTPSPMPSPLPPPRS